MCGALILKGTTTPHIDRSFLSEKRCRSQVYSLKLAGGDPAVATVGFDLSTHSLPTA
jgi:hypothetical protein